VVGGAIKRDVVLQAVGVVLQERETLVFARLTDPRYLVSSSGVRLLEPSPSSAVDPAGIGTVFDGRDGMVLVRFDRGLPAGTKRIRFSLGLLTGPYVSGLPTVGEVMDVSVSLMDTDAAVRSPLAPIPTSEPSPSYGIRGVYGRDESPSGFDIQQRDGFNYIDTGPSPSLVRRVAANGLKAFVWLGGYDNGTCRFNRGSGWVRAKLADLAETAGIGAYLVADGPNSAICPAAPSQIRKRSELIRSIDAEALTVVAVQPWNGVEEHPYADFAGVTDVIGIKVSPCSRSKGCDYLKIDAAISAADSLGMPYWGIVQAYADSFYRFPSPAEIHEEFRHWRGSAMSGYLVLGWRWPPHEPRHWLANHPALRAALRVENHS
jgi:hypothetical protein